MNRKPISTWILRRWLAMTAVMLFTLLSAQPLRAQVDAVPSWDCFGRLGAPINGAKVTLTNEGTSASLSTMTGPDGSYKFTHGQNPGVTSSHILPGIQTTPKLMSRSTWVRTW